MFVINRIIIIKVIQPFKEKKDKFIILVHFPICWEDKEINGQPPQ